MSLRLHLAAAQAALALTCGCASVAPEPPASDLPPPLASSVEGPTATGVPPIVGAPAEEAPITAAEPAPPALAVANLIAEDALAALERERREAANVAIVRAFYELIFVDHRVAEAFDRFGGDDYIQHSAGLPDGRTAVEQALTPYFEANPLARSDIVRVIAQGDLVALHVHAKSDPIDPGRAVVEIFRVEDGRVVEHWDVIQPVPARAANDHSMF